MIAQKCAFGQYSNLIRAAGYNVSMPRKTCILIVLDGWGIGRHDESNPIYVVKPPTFAWLAQNYPLTSLQASGIGVGLPWGEVGNSEVGHLTLGAGKILYQYFPKITMAIQDGSFFQNQILKDACAHAIKNGSAINFAGLLTKANVHASLDHLLALIKMARQEFAAAGTAPRINLHLFSDAKDSPPHTLGTFLKEIPQEYLATLIGRYYAMDRNGNWRLTETAYQVMTGQIGQVVPDPAPVIDTTYKQNLTEEYLPPIRIGADAASADAKKVKDGDSLVFFNYREDSIRQLASSFIIQPFDKFPTLPFQDLFIATMSHYEDNFNVPVVYPAEKVDDPIGKIFSDRGMSQLRLAETYKYAHVTYFFNGLREPPFPGEYRTLIPSLAEVHPEQHPEMMASAITDRLIEAIQSKGFDFILVNYANPDAIAHTSDYNASLEAVRIMDREIARVLTVAENPDVLLAITADHGNIEEMISPITGLPESQHDPSPVPLHLIAPQFKGKKFVNFDNYENETLGSLADVAPTLLEVLGIPKPPEMTGRSLLDNLV
jgi:2,3-bisphosphoglycerate-independent phosphoglycerate mutase